jgi:VCBS repeat-containing protein
VAYDDAESTDEDTPLTVDAAAGVLANDTDPDTNDTLTVSDVNGNAPSTPIVTVGGGILTVYPNGSYSFDPDGQYEYLAVGEEAVESVTYTVSDGNGGFDTATLTITIDGVNDEPTAEDDAYSAQQNTTLVVDGPGVLANDSDPDASDVLVVDSYDGTSQAGGTVVMNADGSFSYEPAADFAGIDTFTYTISDGNGGYDTATVTVTVNSGNLRSVQVFLDDNLNGVDIEPTALAGEFTILNTSNNSLPVQILDMRMLVEIRKGSKGAYKPLSVDLASVCTFDPTAPVVISGDGSIVVQFSCDWDAIPGDALSEIEAGDTIRVTAIVDIFSAGKKADHITFKSKGSRYIESF